MTDIVAIVSGGMDSVTLAYYLRNQFPADDMHLLAFNYGQRHVQELSYAMRCAQVVAAKIDVIDLSAIGVLLAQSGSSLVDSEVAVPEGHYEAESMKATVVPNRNAIMLSIATGVAVAEKARVVATGVHAGDHAIYPDCRPQFISDMNNAMIVANDGFAVPDFRIAAPFVNLSKTEIAKIGRRLGIDYTQTWSCYNGREYHCGKCGTCTERHEALELALGHDPTQYEQ